MARPAQAQGRGRGSRRLTACSASVTVLDDCGSSWVTLRGPLEHPLCPFAAGVPFSCLPAIYPPDMDTQTSWPKCVPLTSRLTSPASPQRSWEPSLGLWIPTPRAQGLL